MFNGYKVVVTGATSGIGLAISKKFLAEGATVIGVGRNFRKLGELPENLIPYKCGNLDDPHEVEKACAFIKETFNGELDTFINNAGEGVDSSCADITPAVFDHGMHLLLLAPILFAKNLYPMLLKSPKKNASIINVASAASRTISPSTLTYCLAKNEYVHFNKIEAASLIGVRCNSISPGFIDTPIFYRTDTGMNEEQVQATFAAVSQIVPCGRIGKPEEVAELAAFLASEDAMYINSADVLIDGGLTTVSP